MWFSGDVGKRLCPFAGSAPPADPSDSDIHGLLSFRDATACTSLPQTSRTPRAQAPADWAAKHDPGAMMGTQGEALATCSPLRHSLATRVLPSERCCHHLCAQLAGPIYSIACQIYGELSSRLAASSRITGLK